MKAIRAHRFGGADVLALEEVPAPTPAGGEVRVRVHATSVNPIDWKLREGRFPDLRLPFTTGGDFSGVVDAVGPDVADFKAGDEVFGVAPHSMGAHAELLVVPAATIAKKPRTLDHIAAAAVPLAALTAWQGLFQHGQLAAGERVLILGASGGVGSFAVQFARQANAHGLGTASGESIEHVRALGAERVIDYERERLEEAAKEIDLVLDLVGGDFQKRAFAVVKKGGRLVSTVQPPDEKLARERGVRASNFRQVPRGEDLRAIARLIDEGRVAVSVARVLPLEKTAEAEELNRRREVTGKIVLRVAA